MSAKSGKAISVRAMLIEGRHSLSLGRVIEVVELVRSDPKNLEKLIDCMWDDHPGVASRAADCVERSTRESAIALQRWKASLLGLLTEALPKKLRWNLALFIPRLRLSVAECRRVALALEVFLEQDQSSIVRTASLQGLTDLTRQNPAALPEVLELLRFHSRSGTAAMRARCRNLLKKLERTARSRVALQPGQSPD